MDNETAIKSLKGLLEPTAYRMYLTELYEHEIEAIKYAVQVLTENKKVYKVLILWFDYEAVPHVTETIEFSDLKSAQEYIKKFNISLKDENSNVKAVLDGEI